MAGEPILERAIPSTGEKLPLVGLGTWQAFDAGASKAVRAPLERVLSAFAAGGGRLIDSSPMYGSAEQVVGDLVARTGTPPSPFVATKVWTHGKAEGIRQMRDSMRKLRVKTCDLMQVHNLVDVDAHLDTLEEWKRAGHVRYIGITHYTASGASEIAQVLKRRKVDFVQINYSVAEREAEGKLLGRCLDRGVAVIANRPFATGALLRRLRSRPLPAWAAEIDCDSWPQLLLKFIVSHPAVTCAIPATADASHAADNMKASRGRLADEALRLKIAAAAA